MNRYKFAMTFAILLMLVGYGMMFYADWRLAVAVMLIHWGINVEARLWRVGDSRS